MSQCSRSGNKYEIDVYNILKNTFIGNNKFNTQKQTDLAHSTSGNDLICNFNGINNIGIEIKKKNTT